MVLRCGSLVRHQAGDLKSAKREVYQTGTISVYQVSLPQLYRTGASSRTATEGSPFVECAGFSFSNSPKLVQPYRRKHQPLRTLETEAQSRETFADSVSCYDQS